MKFLPLLLVFVVCGCTLLQDYSTVYRYARSLPDTAFVYRLPYAPGTAHRVVQGYHSYLSHRGNFAIDFQMKRGTGVYAARGGVVVFVRQCQVTGGVGKRFVDKANSITVRHADSTFGHYLHLQYNGALVAVGDTVQQGQFIGLSGSTGFSAFPHLHFEVTGGLQKATDEIPVRFQTEDGARFLQPLHRYKAVVNPTPGK